MSNPLILRIANTIMGWDIEEFPSGSVFAYDKTGKRISLYSQFHRGSWDPTTNNDDMDQVIEQMRNIGFNFRLEYNKKDKYNQDHIYALFRGEKFAFSGIAETKLVAITKALTDFIDLKEKQNETNHTEVGSNRSY
jgi:hypothetical protein